MYATGFIAPIIKRSLTISQNSSQEDSGFQLQQQELVRYLYSRLPGGISSTLIVSSVAAFLVYHELALQGLQIWVAGWFLVLCLILLTRYLVMLRFKQVADRLPVFDNRKWHRLFFVGAVSTGAYLGTGGVLAVSFVSQSVQVMLHLILLGVSVGAIAFLSTSFKIYVSYLLVTLLPITFWLLSTNRLESYILGFMTFYLMVVVSLAVRHMNRMIKDSQYYRFENQLLIDDLRGLLDSVSDSNRVLEKLSVTDEVTGLSNFRAFRMQLESLLGKQERQGDPVCLAKISIDYFYEYNLTYGQPAGDQLLRQVARIIESNLTSDQQWVARLRGAEFAVFLPGLEPESARSILDQVVDQLRNRRIEHRNSRADPCVSLSIGLGFHTVAPATTAKHLLEKADRALRLASENGRNRIEMLKD